MTELSIQEAHERLSRVNELLGQQAHKERVTVVQLESYDEDDIV